MKIPNGEPFHFADVEERDSRLELVIKLSSELDRIMKKTDFAIDLGKLILEMVIEGAWTETASIAKLLEFEHLDPSDRVFFAEIWLCFYRIVQETITSRAEEYELSFH